jgi:hypothetical protein
MEETKEKTRGYYNVKQFRLNETVYEELKQKKGDRTWNLFFKDLLQKYGVQESNF